MPILKLAGAVVFTLGVLLLVIAYNFFAGAAGGPHKHGHRPL